MAEEITGLREAGIPAVKAPRAPRGFRARSGGSEHHGVLQGVQRSTQTLNGCAAPGW